MNNTDNLSSYEAYMRARQVFFDAMRNKFPTDKACWDWVNSLKMSPSEVRLEVELSANQSVFTFGVTPNQSNVNNIVFPTENRLKLQDTLVVSEIGFFVAKAASQADTAFVLRTYPNAVDFTANARAALEGMYSNGFISIKCNNDVIMPYRGLYNHLYRPQTQQTAALGPGDPADQMRGAEDGFITNDPNLYLIGSKDYVPQLNLPGNLASVDANTRAVLILRGHLAQNSTIVS